MCCQERRPREFAACQLRVLRGRVTFGEERGEKVEGRAKKAACLNLSKQRCCVAFFSLSIVSECLGRREVLAFFALLLSCGQQNGLLGNLSGQGEDSLSSIKCHSISFTGVYFLFICRTRDMDTSFFLSGSPLVPPTACLLSVVPCFVKFNSYFIGVPVRWESKVPLCRYKRTENNSGTKWWVPPSANGWRHTLKLFWYTVFKIRFTGNNFCFLYKAWVRMEGQAFMNPINLTSKLLIFSLFF